MSIISTKRAQTSVCALALSALIVLATSATTPAAAHFGGSTTTCTHAGGAAVVEWNAVASQVVGTDTALPAPLMSVGMSYVQSAVYNAVAGIEGGRPLYRWNVRGPRCASSDAAAASSARAVLLHYFPGSAARVDSAYDAALAAIPAGPARVDGIAFGERAAEHIIDLRRGDGWQVPVSFTLTPQPGVWRPTPPAFSPFLAPWLASMKPFLVGSADQFRPSGPPRLTSGRYARDVREVADVGSATSTTRTTEQTEIARFFGGNLTAQLQAGYRDHISRHQLNAGEAALYLAVGNLTQSDAVISSWDTKLHYAFWRPVTAIRLADTDGNAGTTADPGWTSLLPAPPFPDYVSAHTVVMGAVTQALSTLEGTNRLDLNLPSSVTGTTRHYETGAQLRAEGIAARIWAGIHFRTSDEVGDRMGARLGSWIGSRHLLGSLGHS
ncbi:MAG TPA: vanadium-dependent haloperoxidase [Dermatophilaceae bacterium]|nr:vanadium-dependent haloperoxidase [Dermatophilaceae bacterium]